MYLLRKYMFWTRVILLFLGRLFVLCVVVFGPWKNGGSDVEWLRFFLWLAFGSGICALGTLLTAPPESRRETNLLPTAIVSIPLILALALCLLQTTPLSDKTLAKASTYAYELKEFLTPTFEKETSSEGAENQDGSKLVSFNEAVFPLTDDSNFKIKEALELENSLERDLLKDDLTWGNTISVYPLATREWFPLFWGGFLLVFSTAVLFNSKKSRGFLFIVVAIVGFSYSLLCLAFRSNPSFREASFFSSIAVVDPIYKYSYGTYVNRNCCGGYLVFCLAPCIFLAGKAFVKSARLLTEDRKKREKEKQTEQEIYSFYEIRKDPKWKVVLGDVFDLFNRRLILWLGFIVIIFASIVASMSRGAVVASSAVFLCSFGMLACKKDCRRFWYLFLVIALATAGVVEGVGLTQRVDDRLSTMISEDSNGETAIERDARLKNWRAACETARNYYWFGAGLGSYSLVNGANDVAMKKGRMFYYAENSFIQNLVELGRVGAALFIAEYLLLFFCFGRLLWKSRSSEEYAIGVGGIVLVVGQLITSSTDLGIYLSGNLTTFAVLCGAFLSFKRSKGNSYRRRGAAEERREFERSLRRVEQIATGVCVGILLSGVMVGNYALAENKDYLYRNKLLKESEFTDEQYLSLSEKSLDALIANFERYIQRRDDSFEIRNRLGELEISRYRLKLLGFLKQQRPNEAKEGLWIETALANRLQTLLKYQGINFNVAADSIRHNRFAQDSIQPATVHFMTARRICPLSTRSYLSLSETVPLATDLNWTQNQTIIELYARRIALFGKYDSSALYNSGYYLGTAGLRSLQIKFWRRTLEFSEKYLKPVLLLLAIDTPSSKLKESIDEVLPDDPRILALAPNVLDEKFKNTPLGLTIIGKGKAYFEKLPDEEKDSDYYLYTGRFFVGIDEYERADEAFQKALELNPNNYDAFFDRIDLLCSHNDVFRQEEECVKLLNNFSVGKEGRLRAKCERYLKRAEKLLRNKRVVENVEKRNKEAKEMDERIRNSSSQDNSVDN